MLETIETYVLMFFIYSFFGWIMESVRVSIAEKKWVDRGFLIGPVLPIYGWGVVLVTIFLKKYLDDVLVTFVMSIVICGLLEYFTSFFMEKIFKARWWDYSKRKYNINGRICLETMIPFGVLGCLVVYIIHPLIVNLVNILNPTLIIIFAIILFIIYLVDNIISFNVMNKIKLEIKRQTLDSTEIIRKKVLEWIDSNSALYKHIKNAYPKFKIYNNIKNKNSESKE